MGHRDALVLFDIDGTLVRRAGPQHREALVEAVQRVTGADVSMDGVPVAGMLDPDILREMMRNAGIAPAATARALPRIIATAERLYVRACPVLTRRVCPGARQVLRRLQREGFVLALVTGNLTRIGWRKMEQAGLREFFRFGAFGETARSRSALAREAIRHARGQGWISRKAAISLIGDHINDITAARANGIRAVAVATGVLDAAVLAAHRPDLLLPDLRTLRPEMLDPATTVLGKSKT